MKNKKLQLEIVDPVGNVAKTYVMDYTQGRHNKVRITIDGKTFFWENQEDLEFEPVPKGLDDQWANRFKGEKDWKDEVLEKEPVYQNKETGKLDKLFNEENLLSVWTVRYEDPTRGNKGEAIYYTLSAIDEAEAKLMTLANPEFNKHILPEHYDARYLTAYQPKGNYVIGKVEYFEGDPRL